LLFDLLSFEDVLVLDDRAILKANEQVAAEEIKATDE